MINNDYEMKESLEDQQKENEDLFSESSSSMRLKKNKDDRRQLLSKLNKNKKKIEELNV